ncbi:MAG: TraR/DksA C4-type zinc finger protein [Nitrospiraceae bacterium]|nr:TraR/DksA C4-type zinc finger protein [Nitrospiraceae bacterium]
MSSQKKKPVLPDNAQKDTGAPKNNGAGENVSPAEKKSLSVREEHLQDIKCDLLKQKEIILSEAEVAINVLPEQTAFSDLGDQASAETDRSFMLQLRGREQKLLKKIEEAIDRIDCGTFGICDVCGEPIGIKRLKARPVTTMCIACKTEQEEDEKEAGL